jgi:hypothetical protein
MTASVAALRPALLREGDPENVRARNALYCSAPWREGDWSWRWSAAPDSPALYRVTLQRLDERLVLDLADDITGLDDALDDWAAFEPAARLVMWTLGHERFLDLLQHVFGRDWQPLAIDLGASCAGIEAMPCGPHIDAGFRIEAPGRGALVLGTATFARVLCGHLTERAAQRNASGAASVAAPAPVLGVVESPWVAGCVRLRCVIDSVWIDARDLAQLQPRAVVLLDNATLAGPIARVRLVLGEHAFTCELRGARLLVLDVRGAGADSHRSMSGEQTC